MAYDPYDRGDNPWRGNLDTLDMPRSRPSAKPGAGKTASLAPRKKRPPNDLNKLKAALTPPLPPRRPASAPLPPPDVTGSVAPGPAMVPNVRRMPMPPSSGIAPLPPVRPSPEELAGSTAPLPPPRPPVPPVSTGILAGPGSAPVMTPPPGGAGAAIMDTIGAPLDAAVAGMRGPPRNPMFPPVQGPPMPPEPPVQGPPMQSPIAAANPALQPTQSTALDELLRKLWAGGRSGRSAPAGLGDLAGD